VILKRGQPLSLYTLGRKPIKFSFKMDMPTYIWLCVQLAFFFLGLYWVFIKSPITGYASAVLATVAATMYFHSNARPIQKTLWMLLILMFLLLELHAIKADRDETIRQQAAIADLTIKNLENVTGGNSFPYIVPQPAVNLHGVSKIPLVIWNAGDYPLTGVTVAITRFSTFIDTAGPLGVNDINVGVIPPHGSRELKPLLQLHLDKTGKDGFWIFISAQNGFFTETINFRNGRNGIAYRYFAHKEFTGKNLGPKSIPVKKVPYGYLQTMDSHGWSDELKTH